MLLVKNTHERARGEGEFGSLIVGKKVNYTHTHARVRDQPYPNPNKYYNNNNNIRK